MTNSDNNGNSGGHQFDDEMSERYLFGEMSEDEQERFENAYFADDAFFERFLSAKNDLLDLYTRDELDEEKRKRMEQIFLRTEPRRKRINESRDFINAVSEISARDLTKRELVFTDEPPSFFKAVMRFLTPARLAAAATLLLAAIGGAWLLSRSTENREQAGQSPLANSGEVNSNQKVIVILEDTNRDFATTADRSNVNASPANNVNRPVSNILESPEFAVPDRSPLPEPESPASTLESPKVAQNDPPETKPPIVDPQPTPKPEIVAGNRTESVTLEGSTRSATKRNTAEIGSATQNVSVRLLFRGQPYQSYSVKVATIGGSTVWQARNLKAAMTDGAKSLGINIPASALSRKDYIVTLDGRSADGQTETIREYYFHVERP